MGDHGFHKIYKNGTYNTLEYRKEQRNSMGSYAFNVIKDSGMVTVFILVTSRLTLSSFQNMHSAFERSKK